MSTAWSNPPVGRPVVVPGSAEAVQRSAGRRDPWDEMTAIANDAGEVALIVAAVDWSPTIDTRGMTGLPKTAIDARRAAIVRSVLLEARRMGGDPKDAA